MTRNQSSLARHRNSRAKRAAAETSEAPAGLVACGFLALICGTVAGFESTMRTPAAAGYGYAEAFEAAASGAGAADADCRKGCAVGSREQIGDSRGASRNIQDARAISSQSP
jgi:hypothetical protein